MNQGFRKYYKQSFKSSNIALKRNYIYYFIYNVFCLLASITIVLIPIVMISRVKLVKKINKENKLDVLGSFENVDKPISFWKLVLVSYAQFFLILSGVVVILLSALVMAVLGYGITLLTGKNYLLMAILFTIPSGIMLLVYLFVVSIRVIPVQYLVEINPEMEFSVILKNSFLGLKNNGKCTMLLNNFVYLLIELPMLFAIGLLAYLVNDAAELLVNLNRVLIPTDFMYLGQFILPFILVLILYCFISPRFTLSYLGVKTSLFNDLVTTISNDRVVKGLVFNEKKILNSSDELLKLFDDTKLDKQSNKKLVDSKTIVKTDNKKKKEEIDAVEQIPVEEHSDENINSDQVVTSSISEDKSNDVASKITESSNNEIPPIYSSNNIIVSNDVVQAEPIDNEEIDFALNSIPEMSQEDQEAYNDVVQAEPIDNEEIDSDLNSIPEMSQEDQETYNDVVQAKPIDNEEIDSDLNSTHEMSQEDQMTYNEVEENNEEEFLNYDEDLDNKTLSEVKTIDSNDNIDLKNEISNKNEEELDDEVEAMLNSIPEASNDDEHVLYVDEDGNPIDPNGEVIYVDEDGNPVDDEEE